MKQFILRLLGFDPEAIEGLKTEVERLQITIASMQSELTDMHRKAQDAFMAVEMLGIDRDNPKWWEKPIDYTGNMEHYKLAMKIQQDERRKWVAKHPSLKERVVFHGHCLSCITPCIKGVGTCLGCQWSDFGSKKPDLSQKAEKPNPYHN